MGKDFVVDLRSMDPVDLVTNLVTKSELQLKSKFFVDKSLVDVGNWIYVWDSKLGWFEALLNHIYGGVYFYTTKDEPDKIKHFEEGSIMFDNMLYPKKFILPKKLEFLNKTVFCECPLTKIVYRGK